MAVHIAFDTELSSNTRPCRTLVPNTKPPLPMLRGALGGMGGTGGKAIPKISRGSPRFVTKLPIRSALGD